MTKILGTIAALTIMGAAALPLQATAAEHGLKQAQSTELSSQRHWRRHYGYYRHWGPRRYWGPRYGYYGYPYRYGYPYGYPYGYHRPGLAFRFGPLGFGFF